MTSAVLVFHVINGVTYLDTADVTVCLGITRQAVNQRLQAGTLSSVNIRGKHYIPFEEVQALVKEKAGKSEEQPPPADREGCD